MSIKKINKISKDFDETILINKLFLTEKNENMKLDDYKNVFEIFLNKLDSNIKIIFIEPTPVFDYGPESCVVLNKNCKINKDIGTKYQKKIINIYNNLKKERDNIFIFNPNQYLCANNNCLMFDKNKDLLYFKDNDNLSFEASLYLSGFFNKWILESVYE